MAITNDGNLYGWGAISGAASPTRIMGDVSYVALDFGIATAIRTDGTLWAWGANFSRLFGSNPMTVQATPVRIDGIENVVAVASAGRGTDGTTLALTADGYLWGTTYDNSRFERITGGVLAFAVRHHGGAAITTGGELLNIWTWGFGDFAIQGYQHSVVRTGIKALNLPHK